MSTAKRWSVYLIRTERGTLYAGIATDVQRRLREQQAGGRRAAKYLRGRRQLELVYACALGGRSLAGRAEHRIKQLARDEKLRLIADAPPRRTLLARLGLPDDDSHEPDY